MLEHHQPAPGPLGVGGPLLACSLRHNDLWSKASFWPRKDGALPGPKQAFLGLIGGQGPQSKGPPKGPPKRQRSLEQHRLVVMSPPLCGGDVPRAPRGAIHFSLKNMGAILRIGNPNAQKHWGLGTSRPQPPLRGARQGTRQRTKSNVEIEAAESSSCWWCCRCPNCSGHNTKCPHGVTRVAPLGQCAKQTLIVSSLEMWSPRDRGPWNISPSPTRGRCPLGDVPTRTCSPRGRHPTRGLGDGASPPNLTTRFHSRALARYRALEERATPS
jgi:hypothetical protein